MEPKEENTREVFKEGKGISEKLHEFCAWIPTTEELWDHPVTQLIPVQKYSHPKMSAETYRTNH